IHSQYFLVKETQGIEGGILSSRRNLPLDSQFRQKIAEMGGRQLLGRGIRRELSEAPNPSQATLLGSIGVVLDAKAIPHRFDRFLPRFKRLGLRREHTLKPLDSKILPTIPAQRFFGLTNLPFLKAPARFDLLDV